MSAKEMFEKLGYTLEYNTKYDIRYYNNRKDKYIWFDLQLKIINIDEYCDLDELQAINQQINDLGWNK